MEGSQVVGNILGLQPVDLCLSRGPLDLFGEGNLVAGRVSGVRDRTEQPPPSALAYQGLIAVPGTGKQVTVDAQRGEDTVLSGLEEDFFCRRAGCSVAVLAPAPPPPHPQPAQPEILSPVLTP